MKVNLDENGYVREVVFGMAERYRDTVRPGTPLMDG